MCDDSILNDIVDSQYLKACEDVYKVEKQAGQVTRETLFNYACCLVRSKYSVDIRTGLNIFEDLYKNNSSEEDKRHYLYFMALGYARAKDFCKSLDLIDSFLKVEPNNKQLNDLKTVVQKKIKRDGLEGLAVAGSAALVVGGLLGLGLAALSKRKN